MKINLSVKTRRFNNNEVQFLPDFSRSYGDSLYRIDTDKHVVVIDNNNGLGVRDINSKVFSLGFMAYISPDTFLDLARPTASRAKDVRFLERSVLHGYGIANPVLHLDSTPFFITKSGNSAIIGHEGRARVLMFKALGAKRIPIQFILDGFSPKLIEDQASFLSHLNSGLLSESSSIVYPNIEEIVL